MSAAELMYDQIMQFMEAVKGLRSYLVNFLHHCSPLPLSIIEFSKSFGSLNRADGTGGRS